MFEKCTFTMLGAFNLSKNHEGNCYTVKPLLVRWLRKHFHFLDSKFRWRRNRSMHYGWECIPSNNKTLKKTISRASNPSNSIVRYFSKWSSKGKTKKGKGKESKKPWALFLSLSRSFFILSDLISTVGEERKIFFYLPSQKKKNGLVMNSTSGSRS